MRPAVNGSCVASSERQFLCSERRENFVNQPSLVNQGNDGLSVLELQVTTQIALELGAPDAEQLALTLACAQ